MTANFTPSRAGAAMALVIATLGISPSCGYYSTKSATAKDIKSVYVPFFSNETSEPDLELTVTESIIDELINDNTLKVTSEDRADAVLRGSVKTFENRPFSYNQDLNAEEYIVAITVSASLIGVKTSEPIWQNRQFSDRKSYFIDAVEGGATFDEAVADVLRKITRDIISATVQDW